MADDQANKKLISTLLDARARELRAVQLYRLLGDSQRDDKRRNIYYRLAEMELEHAVKFEERLLALGFKGKIESGPAISMVDKWAARFLGTEAMLRRMEAEEEKNMSAFNAGSSIFASDPETSALFQRIEKEEMTHARVIQSMASPNEPATRLEALLKGEKWHVSTGSWIGDAIYGVNDGLGAVFGIVSGMAGYTGGSRQVVAAGMFGMLASALSMGSGAYLAAKSEREVYEAEIAREKREIDENPEHETEELALIYQLKGFTEEESVKMAATISVRPEMFLKTMAQEELGLTERHTPNPWISMASATLSTAVGALIPVLPFFFLQGYEAVIASAIISTLAHFAVGAAKSLVTARSWLASGTEMTVVGLLEASITFGLGLMFKAM